MILIGVRRVTGEKVKSLKYKAKENYSLKTELELEDSAEYCKLFVYVGAQSEDVLICSNTISNNGVLWWEPSSSEREVGNDVPFLVISRNSMLHDFALYNSVNNPCNYHTMLGTLCIIMPEVLCALLVDQ